MLDFMTISTKNPKKGVEVIYPIFIAGQPTTDIMVRGGDFYAIWDEESKLWSEDRNRAVQLIDKELELYFQKYKLEHPDTVVKVEYLWNTDTGSIDKFIKYVQKQALTPYHQLDERITFQNDKTTKKDYVTKKLKYPIEDREIPAYEELMSTLYSPEERRKIEWAVGSVITGESKKIQKFLVLYGSAGTGKSTILNIIQKLFDGYCGTFDAKSLGSANNSFALESFRNNPLVAIQHDGDLSRIEDNTRLNSLVSHEEMPVNVKFKSTYNAKFNCMLFMGTNKPVRITDAKSGIIRRLIDVSPTGEKVPIERYKQLMSQIEFELGGIANYCKNIFLEDPDYYDNYIPTAMIGASNDFYNFIIESYDVFERDNQTTRTAAWEMYKVYCENAKVLYPYPLRQFGEELKNYFEEFKDRGVDKDGIRVRNLYEGFLKDKFEFDYLSDDEDKSDIILNMDSSISLLDDELKDCPAQYANDNKTPSKKWSEVTTKLSDISTSKLHYVRVPENHIVIDFDIKDEKGEKSAELNAKAASKWPPTYAELSQGGKGIHLHYIYVGDPKKLSRVYDDDIEIKVFTGNSSLRRKLSKCNRLPIATISSGLPLKDESKMINFDRVRTAKGIKTTIIRAMNKEYHSGTKPSVDFIFKVLNDAYESGLKYDVTELKQDVLKFAASSTHHSKYCISLFEKMKFKSDDDISDSGDFPNDQIVFFDVEVFSNLFIVCWKIAGEGHPVVKMINPTPVEIEKLVEFKLVGFNCRRYDNHILYARIMGYDNQQLFNLSSKIVSGSPGAFFGDAYNISFTDIYDYAAKKQSLKKWEIELKIDHKENDVPWDKPAPEDRWKDIADYCANDVLATEAVWNATQPDFSARQMLVEICKASGIEATVNDTTNSLTTKIIFGKERKPELVYTELGKPLKKMGADMYNFLYASEPTRTMITHNWGKELPETSLIPYFPGYSYDNGKNMYMDEDVGKGGYVYAEPGIYENVALLDIQSMHPSSAIAMYIFGPHTQRFKDIYDARVLIKHKDYEGAKKLMNGVLAPFLGDSNAAKQVSQALKIAINSVYGLTSASFENPFRDPRNINNIVALRGALFMVNLKHEVQNRGFKVAHIKTDSIKIPNATPEIIEFCKEYAIKYGYIFEHEATYEKMCLVNDAVYIAKYADGEHEFTLPHGQKITTPWTATGTQFQVPYVFKYLFAKRPIEFDDLCETKSVTSSLYLDMNEDLGPDQHDYRFVGRVGRFCPIKSGCGGGELLREKDGKYGAATGTKGYRWLEAEDVKKYNYEDNIDRRYYARLVDDAVEAISKYGDFEAFVGEGRGDLVPDG